MLAHTLTGLVRFGVFEFDLASGELWKSGRRIRLQAQPRQVLRILVARRGELVTREELRRQLWPDDTFVDFDSGLNVAIRKIREAIGDTASSSRFIETERAQGYRFIAAVVDASTGAPNAAVGERTVPPEVAAIAVARPSVGDGAPAEPHVPVMRRVHSPAAAIAATLIVMTGAAYVLTKGRAADQAADVPRIVVLPLENLGQAADDYLADGMTEEITSRLAAARGLRVVSRTTAGGFEKSGKTVAQIGAILGADYLLEGSVLPDQQGGAAQRVRITAQLIDVAHDTHRWAETYDRGIKDLFAIQTEIAVRVVRGIRSTVAAEQEAVSRRPTDNPDAYRAYLQGLFYASRPDYSDEGLAKPIRYFQQAADFDPQFAQAHAALARAHLVFHQFGHDTSADRLKLAGGALERALTLAPQLPETLRAQMRYWLAVRPDAAKALAASAAAEAQRPNDARVYEDSALLLLRLGRWEDAVMKLEIARTLDPRNALIHAQLGLALTGVHRYSDALHAIQQSLALEQDQQLAYVTQVWATWLSRGDLAAVRSLLDALPKPDDWRFMELRWLQALYERRFDVAVHAAAPWGDRWMRTWVLLRPAVLLEAQARRLAGDDRGAADAFESAKKLLESALLSAPDDPRLRSSLAIAYAGLGRRDDALRQGRQALALVAFPQGFDSTIVREDVALAATMAGAHDIALAELEALIVTPAHFSLHTLRLDPRWDPLRGEPRYQALVARAGS